MRYQYCPLCGTKLTNKTAGDDGTVPFCRKCNQLWFDTFASCSIVLVANEYNEIALLRQGYMSDRYTSFVSGYITPGESAEETAVREVKEEIGVTLNTLEYAGTYWFAKKELLMHGFIGRTKKCNLVLSQEVDSAAWTPAKEVVKTLFPDAPGNAAFAIYRKFMAQLSLDVNDNVVSPKNPTGHIPYNY